MASDTDANGDRTQIHVWVSRKHSPVYSPEACYRKASS